MFFSCTHSSLRMASSLATDLYLMNNWANCHAADKLGPCGTSSLKKCDQCMTLLQPCKVFHLRRGSKDFDFRRGKYFDLRRGRDKSQEKEKYRGRKENLLHSDMGIVRRERERGTRTKKRKYRSRGGSGRQLWKTEGTRKRETREQKTNREGSTLVIIKEQQPNALCESCENKV